MVHCSTPVVASGTGTFGKFVSFRLSVLKMSCTMKETRTGARELTSSVRYMTLDFSRIIRTRM